jgi:hypothetical protein
VAEGATEHDTVTYSYVPSINMNASYFEKRGAVFDAFKDSY